MSLAQQHMPLAKQHMSLAKRHVSPAERPMPPAAAPGPGPETAGNRAGARPRHRRIRLPGGAITTPARSISPGAGYESAEAGESRRRAADHHHDPTGGAGEGDRPEDEGPGQRRPPRRAPRRAPARRGRGSSRCQAAWPASTESRALTTNRGALGAAEQVEQRDHREDHRRLPRLHSEIEGEQRQRDVVAGEGERFAEREGEAEAVEQAEEKTPAPPGARRWPR